MNKINRLLFLFLFLFSTVTFGQAKKQIFAYGGQVTQEFIQYTADLTGKERPKICFLPTATADNVNYINFWYSLCAELDIEPHVMPVWINSYRQKKSFEEILMEMDAIIVGGGNTLNMLAIWKAQGIDLALKKAYENGIVLAGGSAGSLCWFNGGTTDSRPRELSIVEGMNFLEYSHCPHYHSEKSRQPLYFKNIQEGKLSNGYACDDRSGILFIDGKFHKSVSMDSTSFSYYVYEENGEILEEKLPSVLIE